MAKTIATPSRPYPTPCDNPQRPCPECGGLECLCRPRFFAGQLLTEEDLNRLNHYIIEKNKLHNRYLHGWGVVCGLEVVCDPCSGVVVNPGYALSPCGEDIIVCKKQPVDICSLIKACKKPKNNCDPLDAFTQNDNCLDTTEKWVLAIRYHEKATRGITSLKGASGSSCCSKCACGGSSNCSCGGSQSSGGCSASEDCGCGCGGSGGCGCGGTKSQTATRVQTPPQCEPTAICEGYVFEVCKMPSEVPAPLSPLVERVECCLTLFDAVLPPIPNPPPTGQDLQNWCCQLRENLVELFAAHPGHACQITAQLGTLCQGAANSTFQQVLLAALPFLGRFLLDCICSGLLPPCPGPVNDDRVFLATVTVSRKDCRVIDICNWDVRKFAVTLPMLGYWLSPLQLGTAIKKVVANLCCNFKFGGFKIGGFDQEQAYKFQGAQYPATPEQRRATFSRVLADSLTAGQPIGVDTLVMADAGVVDSDKRALLSDAEMQMPVETLLLNQFALPLLSNLAGMTGLGGVVTGARSESADVADLRAQVASLNNTINQHTKTIADLSARVGKQ